MRRGFCTTLVVVGCALPLLREVCLGQITFIPGPQRLVPNGPAYAAHADFDGDRIQDAAVSSITSDKVTVLFGSPNGEFRSEIDLPVGRNIRGLATGDFNGDRKADIAVVDFNVNRALVIFGNGDGTFNAPSSFRVDRRGPVDIAVGNFDDKNGPDLVTANSFANTATTLFNRGGNVGFLSQPDIPIGRNPRAVAAADFNSDGLDDIAVVNTGARGTDELSLLLNNGVGSFQSVIARNFVVGIGANALTVGDFNNDGVPDIAVLNAGGTILNTFSVSVLLNDTEVQEDGTVTGVGFFAVQPAFPITCPGRINGIPIFCSPQDIKTADFDLDGFLDLAVSFSTRSTDNTSVTAGFVSAFSGRGDGSFDFGTQVIIGLGPRRMAVADFTGDANPDILITEFSNNSVRVLRNVVPPPREDGEACTVARQCKSNFCVDGVCCSSSMCPAGQRCDIPQQAGRCANPGPNGAPCDLPAQCASGNCVNGFCCNVAACPAGQFCNSGMCSPPAPNGTPCNDPDQCASGNCVDDVCCGVPGCPVGQFCNSSGQCGPPRPNGQPCSDPAQCSSGFCVDGFCCGSESCPAGQACNTGLCGPAGPNGTPCSNPAQCLSNFCTDGFCCSAPICPVGQSCNTGNCGGPAPIGEPCNNGTQCLSTFCVDGVCCGFPSCPQGQFCNIAGSVGTCSAPGPNGSPCADPAQCQSGFCVNGACCGVASCPPGQSCNVPGLPGQCAVPPPATSTPIRPTATPTPQPTGRPCASGMQCQSGHCVDGVCCDAAFCPAGQACNISGREGQCSVIPTATPTVPLGNGFPCGSDPQCQSGHCTDGACCNQKPCPAGQFCNVPGQAGQCVFPPPTSTPTPKGNGLGCSNDAQCVSGFCTDGVCCSTDTCAVGQVCNAPGREGECTVPPTPTRTPTPTPTSRAVGQGCDDPTECAPGIFCTDGVCCFSENCPDAERCDIFQFEGDCHGRLPVGEPCDKNTDCEVLLICDFFLRVCSIPPTPTPTLLPEETPTVPVPPIVDVSRGGGCAIGDGSGPGAWVLLVFPLGLWVRRRWLQRAEVGVRQRVRLQ